MFVRSLMIGSYSFVEVSVDDQGLSAVQLKKTLDEWPADKKRPKVL